MDIFAKRLKEQAELLGISNAEAARRVGIDERRYAHYAGGRREPDLATLVQIAVKLGTTPNDLLGVEVHFDANNNVSDLINRFVRAAMLMSADKLELIVIQAEAIAKPAASDER